VDSHPGAEVEPEDGQGGEDDEEAAMMKAIGFGGFGTTKGTKVKGNQSGLAEVKKQRTWRQYMQRKGGFNRPLSPVRK
jgi:U4/U6.U5 tri-snRNP-associated protein 3